MDDERPAIAPVPPGRARADYTCLSKKCQTDEGATVYELPVGSTRCPVCGSKRIARIWTPPAILRSGMRPLNTKIDHAVADALQGEHDQRDARIAAEKRGTPTFAVPIKNLPAVAASFGASMPLPMGGAKPGLGEVPGAAGVLGHRTPIPGPGSKRDTDYIITKQGKVERIS